MKRIFVMNGKTYNSMMDIARELGVKRVYPRNFAKLGIIETTGSDDVADVAEETVADVAEETVADVAEETVADVAEETVADGHKTKKNQKSTHRSGTKEDIEEAKKLTSDSNVGIVEFNELIKYFSIPALVTMAEQAGVKTWENITNEPIRRMRLLMELKSHYYPGKKIPVKSASGWKKFSIEELMKIALDKGVDYKHSDDRKILRMWVTMALNKSGLNPEDFKQEDSANA